MTTKDKHIYVSEHAYDRIIVISDIHAHSAQLNKMLQLIDLKPKDLLVINGDFINRGKDSMAVIERIMELSELENVIILAGNHEIFMLDFVRRKKFKHKICRLLDTAKYPTMIHEMYHQLKKQGIEMQKEPLKLSKQLKKAFKPKFDFIKNLPIVLETENFIFSHSAYETHYTIQDNFYDYIKNDDFVKTTQYHQKTIVIGHMPVNNIAGTQNHHAPYYLENKNIYMIDGGLGVIKDGVLNALFIETKGDKAQFRYTQIE